MAEYRDRIQAAGGTVEYIYEEGKGVALSISGSNFRAMYQVAVSIDGKHLLTTVPVAGMGQTIVAPQPSVPAFVQSDEQGMWGRNCPACRRYFRTEHVVGDSTCPYCAIVAEDLAFTSADQMKYLTACYDAFAHAHLEHKTTSVRLSDISDEHAAWHYSEEKQQLLFECKRPNCGCKTDILGEFGFCPRCGMSNARERFFQTAEREAKRFRETDATVQDREERREVWEQLTVNALSRLEPLARHLRRPLLLFPMTPRRRDQLARLNFQKIKESNERLREWLDISMFEWAGNKEVEKRVIRPDAQDFVVRMMQKRHILQHNGGIVDEEYMRLSGDSDARLDERVSVKSGEVKRLLSLVEQMAINLIDNVELGFKAGVQTDDQRGST